MLPQEKLKHTEWIATWADWDAPWRGFSYRVSERKTEESGENLKEIDSVILVGKASNLFTSCPRFGSTRETVSV